MEKAKLNTIKIIQNKLKDKNLMLFLIIIAACVIRCFKLANIPAGVSNDEAYAAYNAYSILHYGVDSWGYKNPVYFVAWGSGMNILNSYLMIPFIKILGLNIISIRLPQIIFSCLGIIFFYLLLKKTVGEKIALFGTFILAVQPWHILMARTNIEAALLPNIMIMAAYFFIKSMDNAKWLYLTAVLYGLALYAYATVWPVLPFIILLEVVYGIYHKKLSIKSKELWISAAVLFIMALPLMLFLLVNYEVIPEISTEAISIPKLAEMRKADISLKRFPENIMYTLNLLSDRQINAGHDFLSFSVYGLFYRYSSVFILIGSIVFVADTIKSIRKKEYDKKVYLLIWLLMAFALGTMLVKVNNMRMNVIYPMITLCIAYAVYEISKRFWKPFVYVMAGVYFVSFLAFCDSYKKYYNIDFDWLFQPGVENCVEYAIDITDDTIYVDSDIQYPKILFYSRMPVNEFVKTVKWADYPSQYCTPVSYGRFVTYMEDSENFAENEKPTGAQDYGNIKNLTEGVYIFSDKKCEEMNIEKYIKYSSRGFSVVIINKSSSNQ